MTRLDFVQAGSGFSADHYPREVFHGIVSVAQNPGHIVVVPLMAI